MSSIFNKPSAGGGNNTTKDLLVQQQAWAASTKFFESITSPVMAAKGCEPEQDKQIPSTPMQLSV